MNSEDFRAEYFQLINRINNLSDMLDRYRKGTLNFRPKCSIKLLDGQMRGMLIYKTHMEERAKIEGISLEEIVEEQTTTENLETNESEEK
jgi:hypothetical protein